MGPILCNFKWFSCVFLLALPALFSGVNSHKDIFSCTAAVLGTSLTSRVNETPSNYLKQTIYSTYCALVEIYLCTANFEYIYWSANEQKNKKYRIKKGDCKKWKFISIKDLKSKSLANKDLNVINDKHF